MKTKTGRNKPEKGFDHTGRCIMHPPLTLPGWIAPCPLCKGWVNVEEGRGIHGVEFVDKK